MEIASQVWWWEASDASIRQQWFEDRNLKKRSRRFLWKESRKVIQITGVTTSNVLRKCYSSKLIGRHHPTNMMLSYCCQNNLLGCMPYRSLNTLKTLCSSYRSIKSKIWKYFFKSFYTPLSIQFQFNLNTNTERVNSFNISLQDNYINNPAIINIINIGVILMTPTIIK